MFQSKSKDEEPASVKPVSMTSEKEAIDPYFSMGSQLSFGALSGLASGYALRQGGKMIAVLFGGGFMFVQSLAYLGYIEVDWRKVERDYYRILDKDGDGKVTAKDFKVLFDNTTELLKFNMPAGAGFTSGLAYGLTGSLKLTGAAPLFYAAGVSAALGGIPLDIMNEAEKLSIAAPSLNKFKTHVQNKLEAMAILEKEDPAIKLDKFLGTKSLQELRELEANVKVNSALDPTLKMLGFDINEKTLLLERIEHTKKVVKGKI